MQSLCACRNSDGCDTRRITCSIAHSFEFIILGCRTGFQNFNCIIFCTYCYIAWINRCPRRKRSRFGYRYCTFCIFGIICIRSSANNSLACSLTGYYTAIYGSIGISGLNSPSNCFIGCIIRSNRSMQCYGLANLNTCSVLIQPNTGYRHFRTVQGY